MASLTERMIGAAKLDAATYEEVENDATATSQAMLVVVLANLAAGVGVIRLVGLGGLVMATLVALIGWFIRQAGAGAATQAALRHALSGLRVRDVMTPEPMTVKAHERVTDLIEHYFARHTYGGYPVERDGEIVGIVTLHDLRKVPPDDRSRTSVEQIMSPLTPELVVAPEMPVFQALTRMLSTNVGRLVVLERGRPAGLVTTRGILNLAQVRTSFGP